MEDYLIEVKNLTKSFGKNQIIKNLSFNVNKSEKIAIFAPSGSGKTTLLNILAGIDKNFTGSFSIKSSYSIVFQEARLFPYMTVYENIIFGLKLKKVDIDKNIMNEVEKWLEITFLKGYEKYFPFEISGGMKAKVSIIRAFLVNPDIIFMDEPFKSIDIKSKQILIDYINTHYNNITLLLVTHNIDELPLIGGKIFKFSEVPLENYQVISVDKNTTFNDLLSKLFSN